MSSGTLLVFTGVLHNALGLAAGLAVGNTPTTLGDRKLLIEVVSSGIWNSVGEDPWRGLLLWFFATEFLLMICGAAMNAIERQGATIPKSIGWQLAGLGLGGGFLLPASGFWLVLAQGLWIGARRRS